MTMRNLTPLVFLPLLLLAGCASATSSSSSANTGTSSAGSPSSSGLGTNSALKPGGQNHVHSIVVLPSNPQNLYMGTHYRLFHSTDGGKTWKPIFGQMMYSLALDPSHPSTLYGSTLQSGFLRSTDGGAHWTAPAGAPPKNHLIGLTYDAATHTLLLYGVGLYRSTDGGTHFTHLLAGTNVVSAAAGSGATLYAASLNTLMVSHDDGLHWSRTKLGPVVYVGAAGAWAYAVSPIGLYRSTDSGANWRLLSSAPQGIEYLGLSPASPRVLIVETAEKGFSRSTDGGRTWRAANSGIHDHNFNASTVRFAPSSTQIAYTGAWGVHFYVTRDAGLHWVKTATLTH